MSQYAPSPPRLGPEFASPPDSRRPSDDERDQNRLPSLSEALGGNTTYQGQYTTPPSTANSLTASVPPSIISPTMGQLRPSGSDEQHLHHLQPGRPGQEGFGNSPSLPSITSQPNDNKFGSQEFGNRPGNFPAQITLPSLSSFDQPQSSKFNAINSRPLPSSIPPQGYDASGGHSGPSTPGFSPAAFSGSGAPMYGERSSIPFHPPSSALNVSC
jgi:hypothetical protein